jgi:hypothetical protein
MKNGRLELVMLIPLTGLHLLKMVHKHKRFWIDCISATQKI